MNAIRGAISIESDTREEINRAVISLVHRLCKRNNLKPTHVIFAIFTCTNDIHSAFPAASMRAMKGWENVPCIHSLELDVDGAPKKIIRALIYTKLKKKPRHVYLRRAASLRPDWAEKE